MTVTWNHGSEEWSEICQCVLISSLYCHEDGCQGIEKLHREVECTECERI